MPWTLEIHHIDVRSCGDATLIVARNAAAAPPIVRTVLIDGGKTQGGAIIHAYLTSLGIARLDVIAITHYDKDHLQGITALLNTPGTALYNQTLIYDLGAQRPPQSVRQNYQNYIAAIANRAVMAAAAGVLAANQVRRVTTFVNSFDIVVFNANNHAIIPRPVVPPVAGAVGVPAGAYLAPHWLVGREIMWGNGMDGLGGNPAFASVPPPGLPNFPTVTCIAANKYVLQAPLVVPPNVAYVHNPVFYANDGPNDLMTRENGNPNAKSMAFLVSFNNFRYYVGGDLESEQEDGCINTTALPFAAVQPGIMAYLNANNNIGGRVLAMKASHHGSDLSTSRAFVDQVRPAVAIISTGMHNQHWHPGQQCVNVLDGYERFPINGDPANANRHPPTPPAAPYRPIRNYLTGYQAQTGAGQWLTFGGDASRTASNPNGVPPVPGNIRLNISEAESQRLATGQAHRGITAAINAIVGVGALVLGGVVNAAMVADIADKGATYGNSTASAVARAVGLVAAGQQQPAAAIAALNALSYLGTDAAGVGVIAAGIGAALAAIALPPAAGGPNAIANANAAVGPAAAAQAAAAAAQAANANLATNLALINANVALAATNAAVTAATNASNAITNNGGGPALANAAAAAAVAAATAGNGRVRNLGLGIVGLAAMIGVITVGGNAAAINAAFVAGAPGPFVAPATVANASLAARTVAAAAIGLANPLVRPEDAAWTSVAAVAAIAAGATVTQAVAIAAALVGTLCNLTDADTASVTTRAVLAVPGAAAGTAALAGAVAGATYYEGVPASVGAAVTAAVTAVTAAIPALGAAIGAPAPIGVGAQAAATIPANTLFRVNYEGMNAAPPHNTVIGIAMIS